eukprot:UN06079
MSSTTPSTSAISSTFTASGPTRSPVAMRKRPRSAEENSGHTLLSQREIVKKTERRGSRPWSWPAGRRQRSSRRPQPPSS